ncbi:MAG: peptide chain release factor 3 [Salibacteraceae bacterium]
MKLQEAIHQRRTFAIISHPDAGKTTLTEKLLLFGGAIQTAGAVKSNKIKNPAASDFMEIERQRGISVATSVMAFRYRETLINLLDTPGHKDFAEDTYRTLTAVDSVVLVIDCVKGVEEQTERLMEVCRMRDTPVMIFINKLDLEGKDPYDLLDELEEKLKIKVRPMTWPIGMGHNFQGVFRLYDRQLDLFEAKQTRLGGDILTFKGADDPALREIIGEAQDQLMEDVELVEGVYDPFSEENYLHGQLAPVFFGSAVNNFGVKELLNTFINISPKPRGRESDNGLIDPENEEFSGFVFKIHANLDPRHRDRIAFLRVCSGRFERNKFFHHVRLAKNFRFSNPASFMAQEKSIIEAAFPGDVIGLYDTGNFKIGDTLTEGTKFMFKGIPSFSPEIFREVVNTDPMKTKQLDKGVQQLSEEGVAQLFIRQPGNKKIIGTVGNLQFEVIQYRLKNEYGASCEFRPLNHFKACWITTDNKAKLEEIIRNKDPEISMDRDGNNVFMAPSAWMHKMAQMN